MDAEADRGARTAVSSGGGQGDAAAVQTDSELLASAGHSTVERTSGAAEPPGGLVKGEALEAAEYNRQAEGPRQAVDFVVDGLGLFAVDHRPVGRRGSRLGRGTRARTRSRPRTFHGIALLMPASAGELVPGAPGRSSRDPI